MVDLPEHPEPSGLHDLQRFVVAQDPVYGQVCAELAAGAKTSHWMWFVFPQLKGLGHSNRAQYYGIASKAEALAYWQHGVLGPRLRQCIELLLALDGRSALEIFGATDERKLCSCLSLFAQLLPQETIFSRALTRYFAGQADGNTLDLLG